MPKRFTRRACDPAAAREAGWLGSPSTAKRKTFSAAANAHIHNEVCAWPADVARCDQACVIKPGCGLARVCCACVFLCLSCTCLRFVCAGTIVFMFVCAYACLCVRVCVFLFCARVSRCR